VEQVLIRGDLRSLSPAQKVGYYTNVCESLGLNPHTQPLAYIVLNGKEVLYAKKDATEQLRKIHGVSITAVTSQRIDDVFVVTASATDRSGRSDTSTGAVAIANLKGEALANGLMKAETKAKRRVTLSICGLGMLDETEVEQFQQPLVVEAPKRVTLPEGAYQIIKSEVTQWGGTVTVADAHGEESTYPTTERQLAELCEQLAQDAALVHLDFVTITRGKNAGKQKLGAVRRYKTPEQIENERLDAEIAAKEAEVL
jgi:hypothetical protein